MNVESIRLECYREAEAAYRNRPGIRKSQSVEEVAEMFAGFCGESDLKLSAVKMAIAACDPRQPLQLVMDLAEKFVKFAQKRPEPKEAPAPAKEGSKAKKGSFRSR